MDANPYVNTLNEIYRRILALIPANPVILEFVSPWKLFNVQGFKVEDLEPTLAQVSTAMFQAQQNYRDKVKDVGRKLDTSVPQLLMTEAEHIERLKAQRDSAVKTAVGLARLVTKFYGDHDVWGDFATLSRAAVAFSSLAKNAQEILDFYEDEPESNP